MQKPGVEIHEKKKSDDGGEGERDDHVIYAAY